MIERTITWQHALQYIEEARRIGWQPDALPAPIMEHATLLALTPRLRVRDIRNWIFQSVGQDYSLAGVFRKVEPNVSNIQLPHLLRFSFADMETAILFKMTWF